MSIDILNIGIGLETSSLEKGTAALGRTEQAANKTANAADKVGTSGGRGFKEYGEAAAAAERQTALLSKTMGVFSSVMATAFAGLSLSQIISQTDSYTKLTAQLKLASIGASDYANSLNDVRRISKDAQSDLSATATFYARIANGTRELGVGQKGVANITETVNLALKVSGATAQESASAMLQLSQAFGSGTLRGEEFNAVNEAAPRLMKALAEGLGVPVGALKEMATNGQITSDVMARVLPKALDGLREEAKSVQTISGAFTVLKNNILEFVGAQSQANGTVGLLSGGIGVLANNINLMASAATGFVAIKISQALLSITSSAYASVTANIAQTASTLASAQAQAVATATTSALAAARVMELRGAVLAAEGAVALAIATNGLIPAQARAAVAAEAHAVALGSLTVAQRAASVGGAATSGVMSLLGGPIGLITTLLGLGVTAWMMWGRSSEDASKQAQGAVEASGREIIASLDKQNEKLKERLALAKAGQPEAAKAGGADVDRMSAALTNVNALKAKGSAITGSERIALVEQQGIYDDISRALNTKTKLQGEIESIGKQSKAAEWMEKLATKAEKMNTELKTAKKELGSAFTPEIEKRITEKYAEKATKSGGGGAISEKISEYTRMAEAIGKVTALQDQELAYGGKLTVSAKFQFDEMQKINFALQTKKISTAESIRLIDMTTTATAKMVEVEKQAYMVDAIKKNTEAVEKQYAALASTVEGMIAANEQQRLENETIGLSTDALNALILARQDAAIAIKQQEIVTAQSNGTDLASIGLMEREIALLQTKRALTGAGQTSKSEVEAKKLTEDASKKYQDDQVKIWSEINDKAESVFMDIAKNGKGAFKGLEEELKNGLLKLLYEMTVKKWIISIGSDLTGLDLGSLMGGGSGGNPLMNLLGKGANYLFGGASAGAASAGSAATTFGAVTGTAGTYGMSAAAGTGAAALAELSTGVVTLGASATAATGATVATGAGLTGMATAALAAIPVVGWVALGIGALFAIFGSGKDKIPTVLNDLALFNNSLVGLPFLELAIGSDEAAQGLRDVLYGLENATPTMRKLAGETISLSVELMRASGDIAGARNLARNLGTRGMSEDEIAVFDYNEQLRDQIEAQRAGAAAAQSAASAERQLSSQRYDLAGKLNVLLGRQTQQQFDRAKELAAATDEAVISMLNLIYQMEDLNSAVDASYAKLERSIAAERKLADVRLKSATDLAAALKTAKDAISPSLDRAGAQSQIAMYVALAKAGGVLPTAAALKPALDSIAKPATDLFKTFEDYAIDQARTANDIADLAGYADAQVTEAQQTIDKLDAQLETAKSQLDALKGIDNSVTNVANAVLNFEASMMALSNAKTTAAAFNYAAPAVSTGGGGGGSYYGGGGSTAASATAGMDADIVAAFNAYYGRNPDQSGYDHFIKSGLTGDAMMQAILKASIADKAGADYNYALSKGYDPNNPMLNFYHGTGKYKATAPVVENYAIGSNYIPYDQIANIHQGEEITPRPYVDMQRAARDETNLLMARLVQSNEELKAEVISLRQSSDRGNENTRRAADTLQGQQGVPFLVTVVS